MSQHTLVWPAIIATLCSVSPAQLSFTRRAPFHFARLSVVTSPLTALIARQMHIRFLQGCVLSTGRLKALVQGKGQTLPIQAATRCRTQKALSLLRSLTPC